MLSRKQLNKLREKRKTRTSRINRILRISSLKFLLRRIPSLPRVFHRVSPVIWLL